VYLVFKYLILGVTNLDDTGIQFTTKCMDAIEKRGESTFIVIIIILTRNYLA